MSLCQCKPETYPFHCPRHKARMGRISHAICKGERKPEQREELLAKLKAPPSDAEERRLKAARKRIDDHAINYPCPHRAGPLSIIPCKPCEGSLLPVYQCDHFDGHCTINYSHAKRARTCVNCPVRPETGWPLLTIGIPTYDDFDGTWFTVHSLMMHQQGIEQCEIVILDNNPTSWHGERLAKEFKTVPGVRYVPWNERTGSHLPKQRVFDIAAADYVLILDCHVLLELGVIRRLLDYYAENPETNDLLMGPILTIQHRVSTTHQKPEWGKGAFGKWDDNCLLSPDGKPIEIWQQGTGLFSCRREAFAGFHPEFRGHGGCETYLMEKTRRNGGKVLCLPWMKWLHRFGREKSPHPVLWRDKLRNYLLGAEDLGQPFQPILNHFKKQCPQICSQTWREFQAQKLRPSFDRTLQEWGTQHASGAIPRSLWGAVAKLIRPDMRTLELGSGLSTWLFDRSGCNHTAVEHDERWAAKSSKGLKRSQVLVRPIVDGWYEWDGPETPPELLLVDGPPGSIGRMGMLRVLDRLVGPQTVVVLDDVQREEEAALLSEICERTGRTADVREAGQRRFAVIPSVGA